MPIWRRMVIGLCSLWMMVTLVPGQALRAQQEPTVIEVAKGVEVPRSGGKLPDIDAGPGLVHLASNPLGEPSYWRKAATSTQWSSRTRLGSAAGADADAVDFTTATVAVSKDGGTVYVAWLDQNDDSIYIRRKVGDGDFGPRRRIGELNAFGFGSWLKLAVASNGQVFITWNEGDRYRYRVSSADGNSWSSVRTIGDFQSFGIPFIDSGPNGEVIVAFSSNLSIYAAVWNGSNFDVQRIITGRDGRAFFEPSAAVAPNGRLYVAWRRNETSSIYYAERQDDGSWPVSLLVDGSDVPGIVSITADEQSNLHMFWADKIRGPANMFHAFKPTDGNWVGPRRIISNDIFNVNSTATFADGISYGHAVYEAFTGDGLRTHYALMSAEVGPPVPVQPVGTIELQDGAEQVNGTTVTVALTVTEGVADQYRLRNDGEEYGDFANLPENNVVPNWQLPTPADGATACVDRTVFGQLRNAANPDTPSDEVSDAIQVDPGVDAIVSVRNPYLHSNPDVFEAGELLDNGAEGARNGDPRYTRVPIYFLEVRGRTGECSGLTALTAGSTSANITDNYYANVNALPNQNTPGENQVTVTLRDGAGYQQSYTQTIYLDTAAPQVSAGTPRVVDDTGQVISNTNSLLVTLDFTELQITDVGYGEREDKPFWGVWLANSIQPIDLQDQGGLNTLNWSSVRVPSAQQAGGAYSFTVRGWSLFSGIPEAQRTGNQTFYTYARILDGAGNPSATTLRFEVQLSQNFTQPGLNMPYIRR